MSLKIENNREIIKYFGILLATLVFFSGVFYFLWTNRSTYTLDKVVNTSNVADSIYYSVYHIVDGDTIEIIYKKKRTTVRLLGIDTPETVDPRKIVECFGKEASDKTKELLKGHLVTIVFDKTQAKKDKYGRMLAYVYREDGLFINKYLLENGFAHEYTYGIPYEKQIEFKMLEKQARENKLGLWGDEKCSKVNK